MAISISITPFVSSVAFGLSKKHVQSETKDDLIFSSMSLIDENGVPQKNVTFTKIQAKKTENKA